jgi:hypothetical protein
MQRALPSVFKAEVVRPITITLIPGLVVVAPTWLAFSEWFPRLQTFWLHSEAAYYAALLLIAFAAGLIIEDIGSQIEARIFDASLKRDPALGAHFARNWERFLQLSFDSFDDYDVVLADEATIGAEDTWRHCCGYGWRGWSFDVTRRMTTQGDTTTDVASCPLGLRRKRRRGGGVFQPDVPGSNVARPHQGHGRVPWPLRVLT